MFEMLVKTMKTVEEMKDNMAHSEAIQAAKDDAQDEVMQMEFDSYDRKFANVLKYKDLQEAMGMLDAQLKSTEAGLNRKVLETSRNLNESLDHELEKVLGQVKGVIEATEEQDKLMDEKVERLVQRILEGGGSGGGEGERGSGGGANEGGGRGMGGGGFGGGTVSKEQAGQSKTKFTMLFEAPSFPPLNPSTIPLPQMLMSKETVIIQQQHEKQQRQDHALINKLKERVNKMELENAKAMNLLERLSKQCEAASERAVKSEATTEMLGKTLKESTTQIHETLTQNLVESFNTINNTISEQKIITETIIKETKETIKEEREVAMRDLQVAVKEDIEVVKVEVKKDTEKFVEQAVETEVKQVEERQEKKIVEMVGEGMKEEQAEVKGEQTHLEDEIAKLKEEIEGLKSGGEEREVVVKKEISAGEWSGEHKGLDVAFYFFVSRSS